MCALAWVTENSRAQPHGRRTLQETCAARCRARLDAARVSSGPLEPRGRTLGGARMRSRIASATRDLDGASAPRAPDEKAERTHRSPPPPPPTHLAVPSPPSPRHPAEPGYDQPRVVAAQGPRERCEARVVFVRRGEKLPECAAARLACRVRALRAALRADLDLGRRRFAAARRLRDFARASP